VFPGDAPAPVAWPANLILPDNGTDYLYFTVRDDFIVTQVNLRLYGFRHYRAQDVVLTLKRPNDPVSEVFLINRPCGWFVSGTRQTTFGSVRATAPSQVNATSAGAYYNFGDFVNANPPGSIQANLCPFNDAGINPIPGVGTDHGGDYQPMNGNFPGYLGSTVNGLYVGNIPGRMSDLAGANARGVWTLRYTDETPQCAPPPATRVHVCVLRVCTCVCVRALSGVADSCARVASPRWCADNGWMSGAQLVLTGIGASGVAGAPACDARAHHATPAAPCISLHSRTSAQRHTPHAAESYYYANDMSGVLLAAPPLGAFATEAPSGATTVVAAGTPFAWNRSSDPAANYDFATCAPAIRALQHACGLAALADVCRGKRIAHTAAGQTRCCSPGHTRARCW
jgi:hypothetical protein